MQTDTETLPASTDEVRGWVGEAPAAEVEATVGWWLRRLGAVEAELARLEAREAAELARVRHHYAALRAPVETRAGSFRRAIEAVAASIEWGKKKSMHLTWGTFGVRAKPARVAVADPAAALAWAKQHAPDAVVVTERVDHRTVAPVVMQLVRDTGEQPDGFEFSEAEVVPFATPSSLVDESEGGDDA